MSSRQTSSGFLRKLAWTVVLALVFSAGLITGQRLIGSDANQPLASVSSKPAEPTPAPDRSDDDGTSRPIFSFYDKLSRGVDAPSSDEPSGDDESTDPAAAEQTDSSPDDDSSDDPSTSEETDEPTEDGEETSTAESDDTPEADETPAEAAGETDDSTGDEPTPDEATANKYTLQVSAYPSLERAQSRVRALADKGLDAHVVSAEVPDKGTYYRVRIGKFRSMDAAKKFQDELTRKRGVDTFVSPL